jgi:hypothetical protein
LPPGGERNGLSHQPICTEAVWGACDGACEGGGGEIVKILSIPLMLLFGYRRLTNKLHPTLARTLYARCREKHHRLKYSFIGYDWRMDEVVA